MNPVRDDAATTTRDDNTTICPVCATAFTREGRQRFCGTRCRQAAWRRAREAPVEPIVTKADTVYQCPDCETRYLGEQRCDDCNTWCARLGPGGPCPCCDEPVAITDIVTTDQLAHPNQRR